MLSDKPLPKDFETEASVLSSVIWLGDTETARRLTSTTPDSCFFDPEHAQLWGVIRRCCQEGSVYDQYVRQVAGSDLADTINAVLKSPAGADDATLERQCETLKELAQKRAVIQACQDALRQCDEKGDLEAIEGELKTSLERASQAYAREIGIDVSEAVERRRKLKQWIAKPKSIVPTKFREIDHDRIGLLPEMNTVLARTSHGKTALMLSMAAWQLSEGYRVYIHSGEQPAEAIIQKLISIMTEQTPRQLYDLEYRSQEQRDNESMTEEYLMRLPLFITEQHLSISQAWAKGRAVEADIVYFDQFDKAKRAHYGKDLNKEQSLGNVSAEFFAMSRDLNVPCVMFHQLNVKDEKNSSQPSQSHVRDCSQLLQDSDRVWLIDRPSADESRWENLQKWAEKKRRAGEAPPEIATDPDLARFKCTKDRNGLTGLFSVDVRFNSLCGRFENRR